MTLPLTDARWVAEIGIIATCFYLGWQLIRGTPGAKVLAGLVILVVSLTLIATVLKLQVITEMLRSFTAFFLVALVVIFQPELRRFLATLGGRHLLAGAQQQSQVIEEVVGAIEALQAERYGALIAFERQDMYQPARDTGTDLQAIVSQDLLTTIFFPRTPLHDGGVVIVNDMIVTAAAIFPVTQRDGLERTLGLRHRAAMGLCDETDAVVVVLSEETGIIAVAHGEHLERPLTIDQLRARLTALLIATGHKSDN
ncbi:MAG: diadenylate cyclase CdaA [Candidatus Methylacidiphilales bacterium]|nr:diadenylate cyclase CdaA [Candidatus Methylacidiphilales bacterium]